MSERHAELGSLLIDVEFQLRRTRLWSEQPPEPDALESDLPFAVDRLSFPEWLQFVFVPRLHELVRDECPLPGDCGVAPMAEEYFAVREIDASALIGQLRRIDALLSEV